MSLEAMIMFSNNKSAQWIATLSDGQRQQVFKQAREKGPAFRKAFKSRRAAILERSKIDRAKPAAAAKKKMKDQKERENLTQDIITMGLLQTSDPIEAGLRKL